LIEEDEARQISVSHLVHKRASETSEVDDDVQATKRVKKSKFKWTDDRDKINILILWRSIIESSKKERTNLNHGMPKPVLRCGIRKNI